MLGFLFSPKKRQQLKSDADDNTGCVCSYNAQSIGCPAYPSGKCIWHPDNDPYGLKDREWVDGKFVKKQTGDGQ